MPAIIRSTSAGPNVALESTNSLTSSGPDGGCGGATAVFIQRTPRRVVTGPAARREQSHATQVRRPHSGLTQQPAVGVEPTTHALRLRCPADCSYAGKPVFER